MKPATNTLTEVFNAPVRYVVPLYQRPYVWTREQHWEPLWQDIEVLLEHYLSGDGEPARHFLGAIVLEQEDTPPGQPIRRLVIDGQQRLTTLQLLLAAAARCAAEDGCQRQARLLTKLVENDPDLTIGDDRFKVWPTNVNQLAFRAVMQQQADAPQTPDDPDNTIQEAYAYFVEAIHQWIHDDAPIGEIVERRHDALWATLASLLQIVSINLEHGDNAQVIFETLNARGTPLLAMDLVKNAVFYRAQREHLDVDRLNAEVWEPELGQDYWRGDVRQGRLTRPRAELFLMHWLAMRLGRIVPATELFSQFRTHVLDSPTRGPVDDLIRELAADARVFRGFGEWPSGTVEERFFRHLDILDTTTPLPVALLLYRSDDLTEDRRRRGLATIESWLVRRMVCGLTAQAYNRLFGDLIKQLHADTPHADEVIVDFLAASNASSAVWPTDDQVRSSVSSRPAYGWINQRRLVMLLSALELELRRNNKIEDIYALPVNLTIEHVMPQTWADHWSLTDGDHDEREARIHRLGNLTLTSGPLNSSLSNGPWVAKREALRQSLLALNQRLTTHDAWTEAEIDTRGRELADMVCALWPGPTTTVFAPTPPKP